MLRLWFVIVLTFLASPVLAVCDGESDFWSLPTETQQQLQQQAEQAPFHEGILWQVEKDGVRSVILGTMHLHDPRHETLLNRVQPLLDGVDQVFLELTSEADSAFQKHLSTHPELVFLTEGPSLIDLLGDESWQRLLPLLKPRGIPGFVAAKYQPWFLGLSLAIPACALQDLQEKKRGLDRMVERGAQDRALITRSLDDLDHLIGVFAGDPLEKQIEELKWSLKFDLTDVMAGGGDITDHYFREETQLGWNYLIHKSMEWVGTDPDDREKASRILTQSTEKLIDGRNKTWLETLSVELARTPSLVAVGAMHLPGDSGILALLQHQGFTITRLPLSPR